VLERDDFSMIATGESMEAGADDPPAAHQHGADNRVGAGPARRPARQTASHA